jgi:hypothetical protein
MHEMVDLGHSMTHAVVGLCRDETRTSEHIGISPAEEGWTVADDREMYLVAALTCNVLRQLLHDQHARTLWKRIYTSLLNCGSTSVRLGALQHCNENATAIAF